VTVPSRVPSRGPRLNGGLAVEFDEERYRSEQANMMRHLGFNDAGCFGIKDQRLAGGRNHVFQPPLNDGYHPPDTGLCVVISQEPLGHGLAREGFGPLVGGNGWRKRFNIPELPPHAPVVTSFRARLAARGMFPHRAP